jgi:type I restriction enzyme S subunit
MIADLKPYPEYKESGLPWLGQVPSTWKVVRNGSLFAQRNQTGYEELPILEVSLKTGVRVRNFENSTRKQVMSDLRKYKRAAKNDVAYNMMRMWQGAVGVSPVDGLVSPAYVVARPYPQVEPRFFVALFRTGDYMSEIDSCSHGIVKDRNRLYWDQFKQILSPCPPLAEQAAIVRFLDWANGRLERAIRAKRKVISLLNEQKQAIIHRAVTRGLDPAVPLKTSGIPWLGDIPQHWEVRRLRHLIKGRLTYGANAAAEFTNAAWPRYIRITDFRADGSLKADTFRSLPPSIAYDYMVDPGDILLARSGATVGKAFLVVKLTGAACHAGYLIRAQPNRSLVSPEFLFAFTQSKAFSAWKDSTFNTATIQNIGADKYANLHVPLPSLVEQQAILEFAAVEQALLLAAISRLEREIELLREYRTRIVADVVTGKLDVREAAARLPDEVTPDIAENDIDLSDETEATDEEATA